MMDDMKNNDNALEKIKEIEKVIDEIGESLDLDEVGKMGLTFFMVFSGGKCTKTFNNIVNAARNKTIDDCTLKFKDMAEKCGMGSVIISKVCNAFEELKEQK